MSQTNLSSRGQPGTLFDATIDIRGLRQVERRLGPDFTEPSLMTPMARLPGNCRSLLPC